MSWAAPAAEGPDDPTLIKAMLRRRKSTTALYWRLRRPRAYVYAGAVARLVIYRLAAAAAAILAITLLAFAGAVAGDIGYPRWPALRSIHGGTIRAAADHAQAELGHWAPAFLAFGLALVIIPRPHRWLFRITMAGGAALGYYQQRLPAFPRSAVASGITRGAASLVSRIKLPVPTSSAWAALVPMAIIVLAGYILYRNSYAFTARTRSLIPHRPVTHYRSTFRAVSVTRRLLATAVTAALLIADLWIVQNVRVLLPSTHDSTFVLGRGQPSPAEWVLWAVAAALVICAPRPQGYRWPLLALLVAMTAYALAPGRSLFGVPSGWLAAPGSFWPLTIAYLLVTGFAFDLVTALLDWPPEV